MSTKDEIKQPEISLYSVVAMDKVLKDLRMGHWGLQFGTVEKVCKQYGIKYNKNEKTNVVEFTAPKGRMQQLIEKLHFSKTPYKFSL